MTDEPGVRLLDDVRVLEIASLAPAQLAMHLADLGAEVIKIEPPKRGDATRLIARQPGHNDSGLHRRWNRGKKSVAVDTTSPEGLELVRRLIPHVDIVIEGLRPGTLAKMGLGWPELTALKPNLVMVALSGYGQTGPYRDLPSHGVGFDAIAGLADVDEDEDGRLRVLPRHVYYGAQLAPLFAATATLAALSWCRRTGQPMLLDVAQADAAAFANFAVEDHAVERSVAAAGLIPPPPPPPDGSERPRTTTQSYRTADGQALLLMAMERKFFVRLADAIDRPELVAGIPEDQYLAQGNPEIDRTLAEIIATKGLDEWMAIFAAADVPVVPVHTSDHVLDDPQLRSRIEWLAADQGAVTMKSPVHAAPAIAPPSPAPAIGADTAAVLATIGVDGAELDRLAAAGVIRLGPAAEQAPPTTH
jgi:crotonobetainyl-CoA:carnitine CoA-transferase CaiB-like acyl-CoA transferase